MTPSPIGIFDSGYGGLTILQGIRSLMPEFDYLYLGDNARAPYGTRSFDVVYRFTLQAVEHLFNCGCPLVILGCNTASAKALRTIQQVDLPRIDPSRRVLGVIRPTVEALANLTHTRHIGVVGTPGTIASQSYNMEIAKLHPDYVTTGQPCPMWVPLVENGEADSDGADYFVKKYLDQLFERDPQIDALLLGCTHYPLLERKIASHLPESVKIIKQGHIVAKSLADYLQRHPDMEQRISRGSTCRYLTTENADKFSETASMFLHGNIRASQITL